MNPGPPVVTQGATKISASHSMCAGLSGVRRGHGRTPRVGENLLWGGVM